MTFSIEGVPDLGLGQTAALSVCPRCGEDVPRKALECQNCGRTWPVSRDTIDAVKKHET